jgi:hypothetical protein
VPIVGTIGGTFDNAPTGNSVRVGPATVTFVGCANATVDYQFDNAGVARNLSGSMTLSKIGGCTN